MSLTVKNVFELEDDYQNIFIAKSGIHVPPKVKQLKLAERTVNNVRYYDVYILEPQKYYRVNFNEEVDEDSKGKVLQIDNIYGMMGLIVVFHTHDNCCYIFNTTRNVIYLQQGAHIGTLRPYLSEMREAEKYLKELERNRDG